MTAASRSSARRVPGCRWRSRQTGSTKPPRPRLAPGDVVILYTDGVTDAFNPRNERFGDAGLRSMLTKAPRARLPPARCSSSKFVPMPPDAASSTTLPWSLLDENERRVIALARELKPGGQHLIRTAARRIMLDWEWLIGDAVIGTILPTAYAGYRRPIVEGLRSS